MDCTQLVQPPTGPPWPNHEHYISKVHHLLFIIIFVLTADVQVYGVASLSVRVLKAAVQSVVAQVHFGQDQSGSLQAVLGLHVRPVHLPRHRRVVVQGAALHGDITAHSLILVPSNWKRTEDQALVVKSRTFMIISACTESNMWGDSCSFCHPGSEQQEADKKFSWQTEYWDIEILFS